MKKNFFSEACFEEKEFGLGTYTQICASVLFLLVMAILICACETMFLSDEPGLKPVTSSASSVPTVRDLRPEGFYHTVEKGETLWSIAKTYDIALDQVVKTNRLPDAEVLDIGQMLFIPGRNHSDTHISLQDKLSAVPLEKDFVWPLKGHVINRFDDEVNGSANKGIDIGADTGTEIYAARSGVVTFSDTVVGGKGNMIVITHRGNFQTVYAYNQTNLVKAGDVVFQKQVIGSVGRSGRLSRAALHFEIRHNAVPHDPLAYLSS
jgi:murein DD-endopeptidase MepM/ murein hydrolase activator NlpD